MLETIVNSMTVIIGCLVGLIVKGRLTSSNIFTYNFSNILT